MGNTLHTTTTKDTKGNNPSLVQSFGAVPDGAAIVGYQADTTVTKNTLGDVVSVTRSLDIIVPAGTQVTIHEVTDVPDPTVFTGHQESGTTVIGYQADRIG